MSGAPGGQRLAAAGEHLDGRVVHVDAQRDRTVAAGRRRRKRAADAPVRRVPVEGARVRMERGRVDDLGTRM